MTSNLYVKYAKLLQDIPTFVTDLRADAGKRQYKYLGLDTLLKGVKPVFAKHNMGFYQAVEYVSGEDKPLGIVRTVIFDEEDTLTVGSYPFFVLGDPQAVGSAVTYARRYSLYTALGIFPEKDDDGYSATQSHSGQAKASAKDLAGRKQRRASSRGGYPPASPVHQLRASCDPSARPDQGGHHGYSCANR